MSLAKRNSEAAAKWAAKRRESQERALFLQRSSASRRTPQAPSASASQIPKFLAATSHEANAVYMEEFHEGIANTYLALQAEGAGGAKGGLHLPREHQQARQCLTAGAASAARRSRHPGQSDECSDSSSSVCLLADELAAKAVGDGAAATGWRQGPLDPAGKLLDLSDRNLLCASVRGDEAVFGCADHSLYCVNLSRGVKTRQLYCSRSKPSAGHREWVSTVCHTSRGDVASGGVDGKLCLWSAGGGSPGEVQAHAGSISAMKADAEARVVTSGYGGALRVWDCRGGGRGGAAPRMSGEISDRGLPAPCMSFAWSGPSRRAMTGHRDGRVGVFDVETGALVAGGCNSRAHRGHVTVVKALDDSDTGGAAGGGSGADCCFVTGGQDGFVRIWDSRAGILAAARGGSESGGLAAVLQAPAHRGPTGIGAVGEVIVVGAGGNRLVSFGADRRVCVLELRGGSGGDAKTTNAVSGRRARHHEETASSSSSSSSLAVEHVFEDHQDFIYCMDFVPAGSGAAREMMGGGGGSGFLVTGGGDGRLLVHDLGSMRLLYGLGCCSAGAVRCVVAGESRLTVAGDDGNAMLYSFGGATVGTGEEWR